MEPVAWSVSYALDHLIFGLDQYILIFALDHPHIHPGPTYLFLQSLVPSIETYLIMLVLPTMTDPYPKLIFQ